MTPAQIKGVMEVGRDLERAWRRSLDVEWTMVDTSPSPDVVVLQARPARPVSSSTDDLDVWTNANVGEALPGVGTPMTWSIIRSFARKGFERAFATIGLQLPEEYGLVGAFQGRVYLNLSEFMSVASGFPLMRPESLFSLAGGGGVELVEGRYTRQSMNRFVRHLPLTLPRIAAHQASMPFVSPRWRRTFSERKSAFFSLDLQALDHSELRALLLDLDSIFERTGLVMLTCASNFLMSFILLRDALTFFAGDETARGLERDLIAGLSTQSAEPGLAMMELGRLARRSLLLRRILLETPSHDVLEAFGPHQEREDVAQFLQEFDRFIEVMGYRAPSEAELATPRWREDPSFVFEVIRGFIRADRIASRHEMDKESRPSQVTDDLFAAITAGITADSTETAPKEAPPVFLSPELAIATDSNTPLLHDGEEETSSLHPRRSSSLPFLALAALALLCAGGAVWWGAQREAAQQKGIDSSSPLLATKTPSSEPPSLSFGDLHAAEESHEAIELFESDGARWNIEESALHTTLVLEKGTLLVEFVPSRQGERLRVVTGRTSVDVLGTVFYVSASSSEEPDAAQTPRVGVLTGKVRVERQTSERSSTHVMLTDGEEILSGSTEPRPIARASLDSGHDLVDIQAHHAALARRRASHIASLHEAKAEAKSTSAPSSTPPAAEKPKRVTNEEIRHLADQAQRDRNWGRAAKEFERLLSRIPSSDSSQRASVRMELHRIYSKHLRNEERTLHHLRAFIHEHPHDIATPRFTRALCRELGPDTDDSLCASVSSP